MTSAIFGTLLAAGLMMPGDPPAHPPLSHPTVATAPAPSAPVLATRHGPAGH